MMLKCLKLHPYKIYLKHEIKETYKLKCIEFAEIILREIDDNDSYFNRILFSDEATFNVSGCINRHNSQIWGAQQQNEFFQYIRDFLKANLCCGLHDYVVTCFMFA